MMRKQENVKIYAQCSFAPDGNNYSVDVALKMCPLLTPSKFLCVLGGRLQECRKAV